VFSDLHFTYIIIISVCKYTHECLSMPVWIFDCHLYFIGIKVHWDLQKKNMVNKVWSMLS